MDLNLDNITEEQQAIIEEFNIDYPLYVLLRYYKMYIKDIADAILIEMKHLVLYDPEQELVPNLVEWVFREFDENVNRNVMLLIEELNTIINRATAFILYYVGKQHLNIMEIIDTLSLYNNSYIDSTKKILQLYMLYNDIEIDVEQYIRQQSYTGGRDIENYINFLYHINDHFREIEEIYMNEQVEQQEVPEGTAIIEDENIDDPRYKSYKERVRCGVCFENEVDTRLNCGHLICKKCIALIQNMPRRHHICPLCRTPVETTKAIFYKKYLKYKIKYLQLKKINNL